MFIDLSKDRIVIRMQGQEYVLPFANIEKECADLMMRLYRQCPFQDVFVITGPGTFTNMRVGILVLQSLNYFTQGALRYHVVNKLSLIASLHQSAFLPRYGVLTVGQRKRVAWYDSALGTYEMKLYLDMVDYLRNHNSESLSDHHFFIDDCYGEDFSEFIGNDCALSRSFQDNQVIISYKDKGLSCSEFFVATDHVEPFYITG